MNKLKLLLITTLAALLTVTAVGAADAKISPAFDILSRDLTLIKTSLVKNDIVFSSEDFENALGVRKISSVTILSLPPAAAGKLMLGNLEVLKNQTISRGNLSSLRFVPSIAGEVECGFTFRGVTAYSSYTVECSLFVLSEMNYAPAINIVAGNKNDISTYRNISVFGSLPAADPENDLLTYEIITQPRHGVIVLNDVNFGSYKYTPVENYSGRDSFEYTVFDKYGNRSEVAKVTVSIRKPTVDVEYSDMTGHWAHSAAIRLAERKIMFGTEKNTFSPGAAVSRCEFVTMAMTSIGYKTVDGLVETSFADNEKIPAERRALIAAAERYGFVKGISVDGKTCFCPDNQITRAEAAVILNNMLSVDAPVIKPVFADSTSIPAWARDALVTMNGIGVLSGTGEGYISPYTPLTRAQTAQIFATLIDLIEE